MANPSNLRLRLFLRAKGRLGRWDARMHAYTGVATNVNPRVKKAIARGYGAGLVPTSTTGGRHSATSMHYGGDAVDLGTRSGDPAWWKARFQRSEFRAWRRGRRPGLRELIGPDNSNTVLGGRYSPLPEGNSLENQHDDHVHIGVV